MTNGAKCDIKEMKMKKTNETIRCSICGKIITDPQEKEFTQATGMCFRCDHVYGEVLDERRPADAY